MPDIALNTAVNKHFLDKLARLAQAKAITATHDIVDCHGERVMARGERIGAEHLEALAGGRKLKKTIESSLRVEDGVDTALIVQTARRIIDASVPIGRILSVTGGKGGSDIEPLARLAKMNFGDPLRLLLTIADHDDARALEHAVSVSLLSICMAGELKLPDDGQQAAGLAGLLHDIGELYITPAYLDPARRLLPHEWVQRVMHPRLGRMLVAELADYPPAVARAIEEHHERFDGTGYPRQTPGKRISGPGQAVSVAEVIAGLLETPNPLERAELALKIIPGEHARELVSVISAAMRLEPRPQRVVLEENPGREDSRRLFRRICAVLELGQELQDGTHAKSPHAHELLARTVERLLTIQRSFISTGLDAYLNHNHGLHDAHDGVLMFEKAVATCEIQWRLRETARDLALHTAASPDHKALFASLIALLDDDSDAIFFQTPKGAPAPKLAALAPTSFAGSQPYAI
jgi:HD-GYP domain-containing protein (c-di-GMP phosphodiesterase class II)